MTLREASVAGGRGERVAGAALTPAAGRLDADDVAKPTSYCFEVLAGETPETTR